VGFVDLVGELIAMLAMVKNTLVYYTSTQKKSFVTLVTGHPETS